LPSSTKRLSHETIVHLGFPCDVWQTVDVCNFDVAFNVLEGHAGRVAVAVHFTLWRRQKMARTPGLAVGIVPRRLAFRIARATVRETWHVAETIGLAVDGVVAEDRVRV
jgi:hypothetical protein